MRNTSAVKTDKEEIMNPLFSIIVPIYKVETYLGICIDSILHQDCTDFELLLIDDGSPDHCPEICDTYGGADPRVRVIHKENEGLVKARETGIKLAKGTYIGFVDGDDWVEPGWLKAAKEIADIYHPDLLSFQTYLNFSARESRVPLKLKPGYYDKKALEKYIYPIMLYDAKEPFYHFGVYPSVSNKLIRKELIWENRCKDARITMGEDAACVYSSLLNARSFYIMDDYYYHYRQNESSMTNAYDPDRFLKYQYLLQYMEQILKGPKYDLENQLKYHRAFRVKHAVLNESKSKGNIRHRVRRLQAKMEQYGFADAFDHLETENAGIASRLFISLIRKRNYAGLMVMCDIFNCLQKWK